MRPPSPFRPPSASAAALRRAVRAACLAILAAAAPSAPAAAAAPPGADVPGPPAPADGSIARVVVETVIIDRGGTRSAGIDEADLAPGVAGVLTREITLTGRDRRRTGEPVIVEARLTPAAATPAGKACELVVAVETRRATAAGAAADGAPLDRRQATVALAEGEEHLVEAYASAATGGRIALRLRCAPARAAAQEIPDLVTLDLGVERRADDEPLELLRSQRLVAALGRDVSTVVVANRTLPDGPEGEKRYRRERVETALSPIIAASGRLQIEVRVVGDITTMSSERAPSPAPFERTETFLVASGERRRLEIPVAAGGPDDGWTRLTLVIEMTARF